MNSAAERSEAFLKRIAEYSRRLGRVPASIYALGFAALILIFALFYWFVAWLPPQHAFWYSSVAERLSSVLQQCSSQTSDVMYDLNNELIVAYRASGVANQTFSGWRLLSDRLLVNNIYTAYPVYLIVNMQVPYKNGPPEGPGDEAVVSETVYVNIQDFYVLNDMAYVTFSAKDVNVYVDPIYAWPTVLPTPGTPMPNATPTYPTGIPAPVGYPGSTTDNVWPLTMDLMQRIQDIGRCEAYRAAAGYPTGSTSNGSFAQMLGLSALSASLLPLADVTPASALAYVSIWSERILGAILLALILNSLAYEVPRTVRARQGRRESDQVAPRPAGKRAPSRLAKGSRTGAPAKALATGKSRKAAQTAPSKRSWWSRALTWINRGCIVMFASAAVLLTLAVLYAAGIYLWAMAQNESRPPAPTVPAATSASPTPTATLAATGTPFASVTLVPFGTLETGTPPAGATPAATGSLVASGTLVPFGTLEITSPTATRRPLPTPVPYRTAKTIHGDVIAFTALDDGHKQSLWVANADGSGEKRLVAHIDISSAAPTYRWLHGLQWSPDGKWISYAANYDVWLVTPDGSVNKKILSFPDLRKGVLSSLSWSPDGSRIAYALTPEYAQYGQRQASIAIVDVPSGDVHPVGEYDYGYRVSLSWTLDGLGLWLSSPGGPLRLLDPESGAILEQAPGLDPSCSIGQIQSLIWSPNGRRFAVDEYRLGSGTAWLCVYKPDGTSVLRDGLSMNPMSAPSWNPAGNALYFVAGPSGQSMRPAPPQRLMRLDVGTGTIEPLLSLPTDANCAWEASLSPDGRTVEAHCRDGSASRQSFLLADARTLESHRYKVELQLTNLVRRGSLTAWSSDGRDLIFLAWTPPPADLDYWPGDPRYTLYALDVQTGKTIPISGVHTVVDSWELSPVPVQP